MTVNAPQMTKCSKCNRFVKPDASSYRCPEPLCRKLFHGGCLSLYISTQKAADCCKKLSANVKRLTLTPLSPARSSLSLPDFSGNTTTRHNMDLPNSASSTCSANVLNNGNRGALNIPAIVKLTTVQSPALPDDWSSLSEEEKRDKMMLKIVNTQNIASNTHASVASLVPVVELHSSIIQSHDEKITDLQKELRSVSMRQPTADLVIDNIPNGVLAIMDGTLIVERVLNALGINNVIPDVLSVRDFVKKADQLVFSIMVSFKSNFVRDFVISTKRKKGELHYKTIFGGNVGDGIVYINEFLNSDMYELLMAAKKRKRDLNWQGSIWVQSSRILARRGLDRSEKIFEIRILDDLNKLA